MDQSAVMGFSRSIVLGSVEVIALERKVRFTDVVNVGENVNESDSDTLKLTNKVGGDAFFRTIVFLICKMIWYFQV